MALLYAEVNWEQPSDSTALSLLIRAHPPSLHSRDPISRLVPFQLAAAVQRKSLSSICEGQEGQEAARVPHSLSTIYNLLRADPTVLKDVHLHCNRVTKTARHSTHSTYEFYSEKHGRRDLLGRRNQPWWRKRTHWYRLDPVNLVAFLAIGMLAIKAVGLGELSHS